ncbi:MAG: Magnesium transporter MgtE [Parachlamydiales bacterium]|nr:Magnesium transporter MgtE [Parachlamydiales bacterium]
MRSSDEKDFGRSIGEYASDVATVVSMQSTIEEALHSLRKSHVDQKIVYFYVVDDKYHLKGVVSTRQLLLSSMHCKVSDVMQDWVVKLKVSQTVRDALELFDQHPLLALPVVDHDGKLLGAIDVQMLMKESLDLADIHNRAAVFQMIGLTLEDGKKFPLFKNYLLRMPWLLCNIFSGLMCAVISRCYEHVMMEYLILAFFMPLVLTVTESATMQSMAQSLQLLRRPRFSWKIVWMKSVQEWKAVVMLSLSSGILVGLISLLWDGRLLLSMIIGSGIVLSVISSALFGTILPVILFRMKLDPKVASGPVVLMITDMVTIGLFLSLAAYWLGAV